MNLYIKRMEVEIKKIVKNGANYIATHICILRATKHHPLTNRKKQYRLSRAARRSRNISITRARNSGLSAMEQYFSLTTNQLQLAYQPHKPSAVHL